VTVLPPVTGTVAVPFPPAVIVTGPLCATVRGASRVGVSEAGGDECGRRAGAPGATRLSRVNPV
jgi:hypothetical protein